MRAFLPISFGPLLSKVTHFSECYHGLMCRVTGVTRFWSPSSPTHAHAHAHAHMCNTYTQLHSHIHIHIYIIYNNNEDLPRDYDRDFRRDYGVTVGNRSPTRFTSTTNPQGPHP